MPRALVLLFIAALAVSTAPAAGLPPQADDPAALVEAGKYADAERVARLKLQQIDAAGGDDRAAADVIDPLIDAMVRQGRGTPEAEALAKRAVAIRARTSADSAAHARSLNLLANVIELQGNIQGARELYERAADIALRTLGPSHSTTALMRKDLAMAHRALGEYDTAKSLLQRALADRERAAPAHVDIGRLQHNLGAVLWELGEFAAARDTFAAAAARLQSALGPDHPHVAAALEGLAVQQVALGDYAGARTRYEAALAIRERVLGSAHPDIGNSLANLGDVLAALGDNEAARPVLQRAIAIWEKALPPDHPLLTVGLTNLAVVLERLGKRAEGRRALTRAISVREKTRGDHAELVVPLIHLANMTADDGALDAARPIYARARSLAESARGASHPFVATAAFEEGTRLLGRGLVSEARPLLTKAHDLRKTVLGPEHPATAESLDGLARLEAAGGSHRVALDLALQAEAATREHFRATAAALPEREALLFASRRSRSQDLALRLAAGAPQALDAADVAKLWDSVVRSRALVLDEMAWRQRVAAQATDEDSRAALRELADARARLSRLFFSAPAGNDKFAETIAAARARKERLEQAVAARSAPYRELLAQQAVSFAGLRDTLPSGAALIAYVRYAADADKIPNEAGRYQYGAFVMRRGAPPAFVALGSAGAVDRAVDAWRRRIAEEATTPAPGMRSERLYRQTASILRTRVWDPVAPLAGGADLIFVVPDGSIGLVDFGSLPVGRAEYLVDRDHVVHYLSTERDVLQSRTTRGEGLLAVGDPAYERARVRTAADGPRRPCVAAATTFPPLPETAREIDSIAALWPRHFGAATVLRGPDASETKVKTLAPGRRVLHLATHGFFIDRRCLGGSTGADSALVRSGLALARAGAAAPSRSESAADDGMLTGEEMATLDLSTVEWTVLSACESGLGDITSGEGVLGLRRALSIAGTHTVLTSLWQIDDTIARRWMEQAYQARLAKRASTAAAVRVATRALLEERRRSGASTHPFYWAGFVAAGDWR